MAGVVRIKQEARRRNVPRHRVDVVDDQGRVRLAGGAEVRFDPDMELDTAVGRPEPRAPRAASAGGFSISARPSAPA